MERAKLLPPLPNRDGDGAGTTPCRPYRTATVMERANSYRPYRTATVMERAELLPPIPNRDSDGAGTTPTAPTEPRQ